LTWSCSKKRCGAQRLLARYDNISQSTSSHMGRDERKPKTHPWRKWRSRRCTMGSSLPYGGDTCWTRTSQSHTKDQHRYSRRKSAQGMVSGTYHRVILLSIWRRQVFMLVHESERTSDKAYSAIGCLETTEKAKSGTTYSLACHLYRIRRSRTFSRFWSVRLRSKDPTQTAKSVLISFRRRTGQFSIKNQDENLLPWVKSSH
jgi:hypothetical protein